MEKVLILLGVHFGLGAWNETHQGLIFFPTTKLCSQLTEKFERIQKTETKDLLVILLGQPHSIWGKVLL